MASRRSPSLDIVRGFAAFSVLLLHWSGWTADAIGDDRVGRTMRGAARVAAFGWTGSGIHPGVVIFIVLSGFCIHQGVAAAPGRDRQPGFWRDYAVRRLVRIYPVYLVGLLLGLGVAMLSGGFTPTVGGTFIALSGTGGLAQFAAMAGVRIPPDILAGNIPLFTVAVEMLLYATYPVLLLVARRAGVLAVIALAVAAYLARVVLAMRGMPLDLLHGTLLEFLLYWTLGALAVELVCAARRANAPQRIPLRLAATAGAAAYLLYTTFVRVKGAHFGATLILAVTVAVVLCMLVLEEDRVPRGALCRVAVWHCAALGERSYSLYAVHAPLIVLAVLYGGTLAPWLLRVGSLALVLAVTELCFRWIERPFHELAKRVTRRGRGLVPALSIVGDGPIDEAKPPNALLTSR
jgi:peptidoglycan/LPS O-acetylase OafA/YrhL